MANRFFELASSQWLLTAVTVAVRNKIPDLLSEQPQTTAELATKTGLQLDPLARVLRALTVHKIIDEKDGVFSLLEESQCLVRGPNSVAPLLLLYASDSYQRSLFHFDDILHDGRTGAQHAFGKPLYQHLTATPSEGAVFNEAMRAMTSSAAPAIAKAIALGSEPCTVVDIGGGVGRMLSAVLQEYPQARGIVFDLPYAQQGAKEYLAEVGLTDRCSFVPGSFLQDLPPAGADVYLIKNVLEDWGDEKVLEILNRVKQVMSPATRLIISEPLIEPSNAKWTTLFDLLMLTVCEGGRARTANDIQRLCQLAGLVVEEVKPVLDTHIVTVRKQES